MKKFMIAITAVLFLTACSQTVTYYEDPVCQGLEDLKTKRSNENTGEIVGDILSLALGVVPVKAYSTYGKNNRTIDDVNIEQIKLKCAAKTKTVTYN